MSDCDVVDSSTVETVLFERFFAQVDSFLLLIKEKEILASGGAVIAALEEQSVWDSSELELVAWRQRIRADGIGDCHEFLVSQGYFYVHKDYLHEHDSVDVSHLLVKLSEANVGSVWNT
jgi:hypothetical protein